MEENDALALNESEKEEEKCETAILE